jgi:signal transduction histidine kinase
MFGLPVDILIFSVSAILLFAVSHYFWWRRHFGLLHVVSWAALLVILPLASWRATIEEENKRRDLTEQLTGFAPTYALEMARMGHEKINRDTPADDPTYLRLIEMQLQWMKVNRRATSIYTFMLDPEFDYKHKDGEPIHFVICAEVDYDQNGRYEGEDEQRVPIGERYEDTTKPLFDVFRGKSSFEDQPVVDKWGTWVTAYAPVYDSSGKVTAGLGVDFHAEEWLEALAGARQNMLTLAGFGVLCLLGGVTASTVQMSMRDAKRQREVARITKAQKQKFETLVNSIEGVVFEWDDQEQRFHYTSSQAMRIMGQISTYWMQGLNWERHVHPHDLGAVQTLRRTAMENGVLYHCEYRFIGPDGGMIWLRETGNRAESTLEEGRTVLRGILYEISVQKRAAETLEQTHRQLVETSRRAGMAEVATGVLHNVGNVLNSVNVASTLIHQKLNNGRLAPLAQLASLLQSQGAQLPSFFQNDPRGKVVPGYVANLAAHLQKEQESVLVEIDNLVKNVEHIKNIVDLQQAYARTGGNMEPVDLVELVEDALRINSASLTRHRIQLEKYFEPHLPLAKTDRNKVMQILVNLIRNAKHAVDDSSNEVRTIGVAIQRFGGDRVRVGVTDTGCGIPPENMAKLFSHGFTTRKHGHGFGLHSSEAAARELGGSLSAHSEGAGKGATFLLELPLGPSASASSAPAMESAAPVTVTEASPANEEALTLS